jgi:hypothetical protein
LVIGHWKFVILSKSWSRMMGMHWEWLVLVIFLIVWIVSSLIQGVEKERSRMNRSRSLPGADRPPGERPTRRAPTDIDRFLEEVNRRRRQAAERRPAVSGREKPPVPTVGPAAPVSRPRIPARPASGKTIVPVQRIPSGKIPEAIPVTETTAAAEILAVASVMHAVPQNAPWAETAVVSAANVAGVESAPAAIPPLTELLRAPDTLRTAVILREILGPPRSQRPGIRG